MRYEKRRRRKRPSQKKSPGVMNIVLIIVGVSLFAFTIAMIQVFKEYGAVPDTLVTCVFAALGGECGIMGWIKTSKERRREREWEVEDRQEAKQEAQEQLITAEPDDFQRLQEKAKKVMADRANYSNTLRQVQAIKCK